MVRLYNIKTPSMNYIDDHDPFNYPMHVSQGYSTHRKVRPHDYYNYTADRYITDLFEDFESGSHDNIVLMKKEIIHDSAVLLYYINRFEVYFVETVLYNQLSEFKERLRSMILDVHPTITNKDYYQEYDKAYASYIEKIKP